MKVSGGDISDYGFFSEFGIRIPNLPRGEGEKSPKIAGFCAFSKVSSRTVKISEKTYCAEEWVCLYSGSRFPKRDGQHNLRDR